MKRKSRAITGARHKQIGRELFLIRLTLLRLVGELNLHYRESEKPFRGICSAIKAVDSLRRILNSELYRTIEQPFPMDWGMAYYCGSSEQVESEIDARLPRSEAMAKPRAAV